MERGEMDERKCNSSSSIVRTEVKVTGSQGQILPQIQHGGVTYVVSNPGEKFKVSARYWAPEALIVSLEMDGINVGYSVIKPPGAWAVFDGFFQGPLRRRAFVFAKPECTDSIPASIDTARAEASVGLLEVKFYEKAEYLCPGPTCRHCQIHGHVRNTLNKPVIKSAESVAAKEGKKFFLSPSLCVAAGDIHAIGQGRREYIHRETCSASLFSARVHCETAEALVLRKLLDPNKPEHAALLPAHLREVLIAGPTERRATPVKRDHSPQPLDVKPSIERASAPAARNAKRRRVVKAEAVGNGFSPAVDLDQMPESVDDPMTTVYGSCSGRNSHAEGTPSLCNSLPPFRQLAQAAGNAKRRKIVKAEAVGNGFIPVCGSGPNAGEI